MFRPSTIRVLIIALLAVAVASIVGASCSTGSSETTMSASTTATTMTETTATTMTETTEAPTTTSAATETTEESGMEDFNLIDPAQLPVTFPFTVVADHIVVDVSFDGDTPLPFMFDTGANVLVAKEIAGAHGGPVLGQTQGATGGGTIITTDLQPYQSLRVGDSVNITNVLGLTPWDVASSSLYCVTPYGLLGAGAMSHAVWQVDYGKNEITVAASVDGLDHIDGAYVLNFTPQPGLSPTPIVDVPVPGGVAKFLVDTGGGIPLALNASDAPGLGITVPDSAPKVLSVGTGAGGNFEAQVSAIQVPITLGDTTITYPMVVGDGFAPSQVAQGNMGHFFLKNFVVTFDWSTNKMYLDPLAEDGSIPFPSPPPAGGIAWDGTQIVVGGVVKGGPADLAGLTVGDVVTQVDGQSVEGLTIDGYCPYLDNETPIKTITTKDGKTYDVAPVEGFYENAPVVQ